MSQKIVVFERGEQHTAAGKPELSFRVVRNPLPSGSRPLVIADRPNFVATCGQWFTKEAVTAYAERMSGYRALLID